MGFYVFRHKRLPNLFWLCYDSSNASTEIGAPFFVTSVWTKLQAKADCRRAESNQVEDGKTQLVRGTSPSLHLRPVPGEADLCHPKPQQNRPQREMSLWQRQKIQKVSRKVTARSPS